MKATEIDWTSIPLGQKPDIEIAKALGVSRPVVRRARAKLGIPAYGNSGPKGIDWDAVELGSKPDHIIATELGVERSAVQAVRENRGIPPYNPSKQSKNTDWDSVDFSRSPTELAKELGVAPRSVFQARKLRGIDRPNQKGIIWDLVDLGERPDEVIAAQYGVSQASVVSARTTRGIPPYRECTHKGIDWDQQPLGQKPDGVLALEIGVNYGSVYQARNSRGIAAYSDKGYTYEGVACKSGYEAMYDAYLHGEGIPHKHEVKVPGTPFVADFQMVDGLFVEIPGMLGYPKYDARWQRKVAAYAEKCIQYQKVLPDEVAALYKQAKLQARWSL